MGALASVQQEYTKAGLPSCKRVTAAMASGSPHGNGSVPEVPMVSFRSARRVTELESTESPARVGVGLPQFGVLVETRHAHA
jgi:hypothetical protein